MSFSRSAECEWLDLRVLALKVIAIVCIYLILRFWCLWSNVQKVYQWGSSWKRKKECLIVHKGTGYKIVWRVHKANGEDEISKITKYIVQLPNLGADEPRRLWGFQSPPFSPLSLRHAAGSREGGWGCCQASAGIQERWDQGWRWNTEVS